MTDVFCLGDVRLVTNLGSYENIVSLIRPGEISAPNGE